MKLQTFKYQAPEKLQAPMIKTGKGKQLMIIAAVVLVVAVVAVVLWSGEREPEYQGKKLSEWIAMMGPAHLQETLSPYVLRQLGSHRGGLPMDTPVSSAEEIRGAVRHMGTDGLNVLVRWVAYETPHWKQWISHSSTNVPSFLTKTRLWSKLTDDSRQRNRADDAAFMLQEVGRDALPAVKGLAQIEANHKNPTASRRAWIVMAIIGHRLKEAEGRFISIPAGDPPQNTTWPH